MSKDRQLIPLVERLSSATICCVGDLMLDHFIYGSVTRISPEAPIPVLRVHSQTAMLGGLGNVVRNLGALGCEIKVFSAIGGDAAGTEVDGLLQSVPRCENNLIRETGRLTPVKVRYVAGGQQLLRADNETISAIFPETLDALLMRFEKAVQSCSAVILSDYGKGVLLGPMASEIIRIARQHNKRVVVDPKGSDFTRYRHATLIKPNLKELGEASGFSVNTLAEQQAAARKLIDQTEAEYILVTRGADGILLVSRGGEIMELPSLAREVFDVSGAGDTVAASLAAGIGAGASIADSVRLANIAAGIVVAKTGTAVVDRSEIVHEIENQSALVASDKILRIEEAAERAKLWRRMGNKIGLIFGSFERLSPEDLAVLEKLRQGCDRLVVAITGNRTLAGAASGFPDEHARAYLLASTVFSDAVIIRGQLTPDRILSVFNPEIVVDLDSPESNVPSLASRDGRNSLVASVGSPS